MSAMTKEIITVIIKYHSSLLHTDLASEIISTIHFGDQNSGCPNCTCVLSKSHIDKVRSSYSVAIAFHREPMTWRGGPNSYVSVLRIGYHTYRWHDWIYFFKHMLTKRWAADHRYSFYSRHRGVRLPEWYWHYTPSVIRVGPSFEFDDGFSGPCPLAS